MFRRGEKIPEPEFTSKNKVELAVEDSTNMRDEDTKEALREIKEKENMKEYKIALYFFTKTDMSEEKRKELADKIKDDVGADEAVVSGAEIMFIFRGTEYTKKKEAIEFGEDRSNTILVGYGDRVDLNTRKGESGIEAIPYL